MKALLRYFSYIFHALLAAFLIAVSCLSLASGAASLRLDVLPWTGAKLTYIALCGGLFGLATIVLAVLGKFRWLFFAWSLIVFVIMVKGFIFSSYHFEPGALSTAIYLIVAALISLAGAWFQVRASGRDVKKRY